MKRADEITNAVPGTHEWSATKLTRVPAMQLWKCAEERDVREAFARAPRGAHG